MRTYILNPFPINLFKPLWKRITITLAFRESTNVVLSSLNAPKHYLCKGEKTPELFVRLWDHFDGFRVAISLVAAFQKLWF